MTTTSTLPHTPHSSTASEYSTTAYEPKEGYEDGDQGDVVLVASKGMTLSTSLSVELMQLVPDEADIKVSDITLLHSAHHPDPFGILGPHTWSADRRFVIRCWIKDAASMELSFTGSLASDVWYPLIRRSAWLYHAAFQWRPTDEDEKRTNIFDLTRVEYKLRVTYEGDPQGTSYIVHDVYRFGCSLDTKHLEMFQTGSCWHVDDLMGSHCVEVEGVIGYRFAVWAPNARFVSVVGEFNQWDGRAHPMRRRHGFGVWEIFVPDTPTPGQRYMYKIHTPNGTDLLKIDPYAQEFENPPAQASVLSSDDDAYKSDDTKYKWRDHQWMAKRADEKDKILRLPISIYEVHLPSWMRGDNNTYLSYREMAHRFIDHCKSLNFTHIEFLPLSHHPFEGSWGYQVSGLYAPYSRLGKPDDLKYLIDELHLAGIGVFLDFVCAHFVKDDWALAQYDGEACFEYADPREGDHKTWGTKVFNFRRNEVRSFLLGAAYHWLRRYHIDGLRIDAVSSMIYKNYCRDPGDWLPNDQGGTANLEAINMLQELNWVVHREFPGVFTMAEEATSWLGVTDRVRGLGFDCKWDLGWMNDTMSYLCTPTPLRPNKHNKLTFRGLYVAHERWVLPLSHDEVVSGKGSLLDKCAFKGATFGERCSSLKTLIAYQIGLCGRPLLFMGTEFGQGREWKEDRSLDWHEAKEENRSRLMKCVSDLLKLYRDEPALHAGDDEPWNFKWNDCDSANMCLVSFIRSWEEWFNDIVVVCNFSADTHYRYPIGVNHGGDWRVLINTDDWAYGGGMRGLGAGQTTTTTQGGRLGWPYCLWVDVPVWGALMLKAPTPDHKTRLIETIRVCKASARPFEHHEKELRLLESGLNTDQTISNNESMTKACDDVLKAVATPLNDNHETGMS